MSSRSTTRFEYISFARQKKYLTWRYLIIHDSFLKTKDVCTGRPARSDVFRLETT